MKAVTVRLVDAVLRQPRGQRRADHRVRKAGRDAEEEGRDRRRLGVRAEAGGQVIAPIARHPLCGTGHAALYRTDLFPSSGELC